ncbi:hypothetical protein GIB67_001369 [Kingdonia uniflora]|uniref:40S ribosomal protein S12 n=1 Tax=Kingdonia uniflora TaxID=39325 RepID=A0A7J7P1Z3_9MAGN|nr:hypothetical protein GIB67_001369 [Kingdonia uniflora]
MTALQLVLKKAQAHDGLARGLHEGAKVIEKHAVQLCVISENCNQPDYVKLVQALCVDHNVSLFAVPAAKILGEWAGVSIEPIPFRNLECQRYRFLPILGSKFWILYKWKSSSIMLNILEKNKCACACGNLTLRNILY